MHWIREPGHTLAACGVYSHEAPGGVTVYPKIVNCRTCLRLAHSDGLRVDSRTLRPGRKPFKLDAIGGTIA